MWAIADHLQQILFLSLEQMHICKGVQSELECKKYVFITYKRKCWSNLQWISKWNYRPAKKKKTQLSANRTETSWKPASAAFSNLQHDDCPLAKRKKANYCLKVITSSKLGNTIGVVVKSWVHDSTHHD